MAEREGKGFVRDGIIAGLIGATAVAVWFLIVDTIDGRPRYTPAMLGYALFGVFGPPAGESVNTLMLGYTVFHYAAFIAMGLVVSYFLTRGEDQPHLLWALLLLFVVFEIGFYGLTALLSQWRVLGDLAWYQIGAANLVAALLMGTYLVRAHPGTGRELRLAMEGRGD